ncbi:MAG: EFR1 family ferrodoxin [Clostridia bacterium]|nr:EFR1 family ferrodoxin [Clostridia bacterium]
MKVFYFTGSGNSLSVAKQLSEEVINIATCAQGEYSDDSIGIVFPVYCYDIPFIVRDFLTSTKLNAPYIWAVGTCGSSVGYSFYTIDALLRKQGRKLSYSKKIVLPDSCIAFKTPSPAKEKMLDAEKDTVASFKSDVIAKKPNALFKDKLFRINRIAWWAIKTFFGSKHKRVTDACNGCGICQKICPTNNITLEGKPAFGDNCEYCFGCIQWCPQRAIVFGKLSIDDSSKYTHPSLKASEMITRNKK